MRVTPLILEMLTRVLIAVVLWLPVQNLITPIISGDLLMEIQNFTLSFSKGDLSAIAGMFTIAASVLALFAVLTLSVNLYVIATIAVFLSFPPTPTQALLNILGLVGLLLINTYLINRRWVFYTGIAARGSRMYYLLLVLGMTILTTGFACLMSLYLEFFTGFMKSVPVTSRIRVLSEFLSANPVGKALLVVLFISLFVKMAFDLIDSTAYFMTPNARLAKAELNEVTRYSVEFKYPLRSLINLILTLFVAPPLYVLSSHIYTNYVLRALPTLGSLSIPATPYSQLFNILIEMLFFLIVWGVFSYVARFFRGYVNMKLVVALVILALLFGVVVSTGGLDLNDALARVYLTYYSDFLAVGELLLQAVGFVP